MEKKSVKPWMFYGSAYGGESLRANARGGIDRLQRLLALVDPSCVPLAVELQIVDEQTESLYRATRGERPPEDDPMETWRVNGGERHPLAEVAERRFGEGERQRWGIGAGGDLWRTQWKLEGQDALGRWPALLEFVESVADAPPIYPCWSRRREVPPTMAPVSMHIRWTPTLRRLDGSLPEGALDSTVHAFLGLHSSVIFDLHAPWSTVDADFAAWERAACQALGVDLCEGRWTVHQPAPPGGHRAGHHLQGRYRRRDWIPGNEPPDLGHQGWGPLVEELLAPRLGGSREHGIREALLLQPIHEVVAAVVRGMGPLAGAPLERGRNALIALISQAPDRSLLEPALERLFADPPNNKVCRHVGFGFGACFGDDWFLALMLAIFEQKKVPTPVLELLEECAIASERRNPSPAARALCVHSLRRMRAKGAPGKRGTFRNVLILRDDGSAWPTLLLEAGSVPPGWKEDYPHNTWAAQVHSAWGRQDEGCGREQISDPDFSTWIQRLPPIGLDLSRADDPWRLDLTDEERADLEAREAAWLGER